MENLCINNFNLSQVLIVVSDGRSGDNFEEAARRLRESGVYVFSIGKLVTKCFPPCLINQSKT